MSTRCKTIRPTGRAKLVRGTIRRAETLVMATRTAQFTMTARAAGRCTNQACFVAHANEPVRPHHGISCWNCGHAVTARVQPKPRRLGALTGVAVTLFLAGVTLGGAVIAKSTHAHAAVPAHNAVLF